MSRAVATGTGTRTGPPGGQGPDTGQPQSPRTLRYRFRKAWRAVLLLAIIPFLQPGLITQLVPGINSASVVFVAGVIALVPLSTFVEVVTEDLIERLGQFVGGLLHAFFSNAAFFVLTASTLIEAHDTTDPAVAKSLITIVQSSIAGTIVIDILFILGIAIFIGSMRNGRMRFDAEISNQYAEMLTVAVIALALPTLASRVQIQIGLNSPQFNISPAEASNLSNITAGILIVAYIGYLGWTVFKFRDKEAVPEDPEEASAAIRGDAFGALAAAIAPIEEEQQRVELEQLGQAGLEPSHPTSGQADTLRRGGKKAAPVHPVVVVPLGREEAKKARSVRDLVNDRLAKQEQRRQKPMTAAEREERDENIGIELWELGVLILGTAGIVFISEGMSHSIRDGILNSTINGFKLNEFFVGFIVIPIASNLVELAAGINTAWHDRLETCLATTAGSAIQVALLVAPLLVIVGHFFAPTVPNVSQMDLVFGLFILAVFALIAYLFQIITVDGETTWLEGLQLTSFFAVLAVVAFYAGA